MVVTGSQLFLIGGSGNYTGTANFNDVWVSDDGVLFSSATGSASWLARSLMGAVFHSNQLWIYGGRKGAASWVNDVFYSDDGTTWNQRTASAGWSSRFGMGAVAYNGAMWVIGGGTGASTYVNDVWCSTNGLSWFQVTPSAAFAPRRGMGVTVHSNRMYLAGGIGAGPVLYNDVYTSVDGVNWVQLTNAAPWAARNGLALISHQNRLMVFGGDTSTSGVSPINDVWESFDGAVWTPVTAPGGALWGARMGMGVASFAGHTRVVGGYDGSVPLGDVYGDVDNYVSSNTSTARTYRTPQTAVDAATNNYSVLVDGMVSNTLMVVGKTNFSLLSAPWSTNASAPPIKWNGTGAGVAVNMLGGNGVTVAGFQFTNAGVGIMVNDGSNHRIASNQFTGLVNQGLVMKGIGSNHLVGWNVFSGNSQAGVQISSNGLSGVRIITNTFSGPGQNVGLQITDGRNHLIQSNDIQNHGQTGLQISSGVTGSRIQGNYVRGNGTTGITLESNTTTNNWVVSNWVAGGQNEGLRIQDARSNYIQQNFFTNHFNAGVVLAGTATGNRIHFNNIGLNGNPNMVFLPGNPVVSNFWHTIRFFNITNGAPGTAATDVIPYRLGSAGPNAPVVYPPAAPTNLALTNNNGQFQITWSAVPGATGYLLYRNPGVDTNLQFGTYYATSTGNAYTDVSPLAGVTNYYYVASMDSMSPPNASWFSSNSASGFTSNMVSNGNTGLTYTSLATAFAAVPNGGNETLWAWPGIYLEHGLLVSNKTINLRSVDFVASNFIGNTLIYATNLNISNAIWVTSGGKLTMEGFTLRFQGTNNNWTPPYSPATAIMADGGATTLDLRNCRFEGNNIGNSGVSTYGATGTVSNNVFWGFTFAGSRANQGTSVWISNVYSNNGTGYYHNGPATSRVFGNQFVSNQTSVYAWDGTGLSLSYNTVWGGGYGFSCNGGSPVVEFNTFAGGTTRGLSFSNASAWGGTFQNNIVFGYPLGVYSFAPIALGGNSFWSNTTWTNGSISLSNSILGDPSFVAWPTNLRLTGWGPVPGSGTNGCDPGVFPTSPELRVLSGPNTRLAGTFPTSTNKLAMFQFALYGSGSQTVTVTQVTVSHAGSYGYPLESRIGAVHLVQDGNQDGFYSVGPDTIVATSNFNAGANSNWITFSGLGLNIAPGANQKYVVAYDVANMPAGETIQPSVSNGAVLAKTNGVACPAPGSAVGNPQTASGGVARFSVQHSGMAAVGTPEPVTITALDSNNQVVTYYTGTVTNWAQGQSGQVAWTTNPGASGVFVSNGAGVGSTYTFAAGDNGVVSLKVANSAPDAAVSFLIKDTVTGVSNTNFPAMAFLAPVLTNTATGAGFLRIGDALANLQAGVTNRILVYGSTPVESNLILIGGHAQFISMPWSNTGDNSALILTNAGTSLARVYSGTLDFRGFTFHYAGNAGGGFIEASNSVTTLIADRFIGNGASSGIYNHDGGRLWVQQCFFTNINGWVLGQNIGAGPYPDAQIYVGSNLFLGNTNGILSVVVTGSGGKATLESNVMLGGDAGIGIVGNGITRYNLVRNMTGYGGSYCDGNNTNHNNTYVGGSQAMTLMNGAVSINNIVSGWSRGITNQGGGAGDYNLYFGNSVNLGNMAAGPHDVFGDPAFVNTNGGNWGISSVSAALDAGTNLDGLAQGTGRDMGFLESAFSLNTGAIYVSTNGNDGNGGTLGAPVRTVQVGWNKALSGGKTNLFLTAGLYSPGSGLNPSGAGATLTNGSNLFVSGGWDVSFSSKAGLSVLDGNGALSHVLVISNTGYSVLEGLSIRGGSATGAGADSYGAGIYGFQVPAMTVTNVVIATNRANADGGGIYLGNATNLVMNGSFISNAALGIGGGLVLDSSPGAFVQGSFTSNSGQNAVGGMVARNQSLQTIVSNATFLGNRAVNWHIGGLSIQDSSRSKVSDSFFIGNSANIGTAGEGVGGLMVFNSTNVFINNVRFFSNQAVGWGGGMAAQLATNLAIDGPSLFVSNTAKGSGGGLFATGLTGLTNLGIFRSNFSSGGGGAMGLSNVASNLIAGILERNSASIMGGALYLFKGQGDVVSAMVVSNYTTNNSFNGSGGAAWVDSCSNTALSGSFQSNTSAFNGGAVYLPTSVNVNLSGFFFRNRANGASSGAVFANGGSGHQFSGTFAENSTTSGGGAAYISGVIGATFNGNFYSNSASQSGGALGFATGCYGNSIGGMFLSNTGSSVISAGGAVWFDASCQSNQIGGTYVRNYSYANGGAVVILGTNNAVTGTFFSNTGVNGGALSLCGTSNSFTGLAAWNSSSNGGGVHVYLAVSNYIGGLLLSNFASNQGGGLYIQQSTNTLVGAIIDSNHAVSDGGGVKIVSNAFSNWLLAGSIVSRNSGNQGGGVYLRSGTNFLLGQILSNFSFANGGGVYVGYEAGNVLSGRIIGNTANNGYGGGIYIFAASNTTVSNGEITGNPVAGTGDGSAVAIEKSSSVVLKDLVMTNGIGIAGKAVVCLRNLASDGGLVISSNLFGASNAAGMVGVSEVLQNVTNQTISSNLFDPSGLGHLYSDMVYLGTNNLAMLNLTNYHQGSLNSFSNRILGDIQAPVFLNVNPVNGLPVYSTSTNLTGQVQEWGGNIRVYTSVNGGTFALASNGINAATGFFDLSTNLAFTNNGPNVTGLYAVDDAGNTTATNWLTNWVTILGATNIVFVDPFVGSDTNIGNHTNFPVKTVQTAFALASSYGYTNIRLRAGVFTNNGGLTNLFGAGVVLTSSGWVVTGGWNGGFNSQTGSSILDGKGSLLHVMVVSNGTQVTIGNLDLVGGQANGAAPDNEGGGLWISHMDGLWVSALMVSNNNAASQGGGVKIDYVTNASLNLTVFSNQSAQGGGVVLNHVMNTTLAGHIAGNFTTGASAGVYYAGGTSNRLSATVCSNVATSFAGGVRQDSLNFWGTGPVFMNTATAGGGYFVMQDGGLYHGLVASNSASARGGGLFINGNNNDIQATVLSNAATIMGGGIHLVNANGNLLGGPVLSNQAGNGGNISMESASYNTATNVVAFGNAVQYGGGMYLSNSMSNHLMGWVASNLALGGGGGLALLSSHTNWVQGTLFGNLATNGGMGGGALASNSQMGLWNGNILLNQATFVNGGGGGLALLGNSFGHEVGGLIASNSGYRGGGLWLEGHTNTILAVFAGNSASQVGGGIWAPFTVVSNRIGGVISSNSAGTSSGGGGYFVDTRDGIFDGGIHGNSAQEGGGLRIGAASTRNTISGVVSRNSAVGAQGGGGLYVNGTSNSYSGLFSNNSAASGNGGGLRVLGTSNRFSGMALWNQAINGGGLSVEGNLIFVDGTVMSNAVTADGGGLFITNAGNTIFGANALVASNRANGEGGGVHVSGIGHQISGRVHWNQAPKCGAVSIRFATNIVVSNFDVAMNFTSGNVAAIGIQVADTLKFSGNWFTNNAFTGATGRVIQFSNAVNNVIFTSNTLSGTNGATNAIGVEEITSDLTGHTAASNRFDLSTLGVLYSDAANGNLGKVGEVNTASLLGALFAEQNGGYGDGVPPTLAQTNLVQGQFVGTITNSALGWADDRGAVSAVMVSLNGNPFASAAMVFNAASRRVDWSTNLVYGNGIQEVRFYAVDDSGNTSSTQYITNYANTLGVTAMVTNGLPAPGVWGTATVTGTNAAMPFETTAWAWALDGGVWTSVPANTNAAWSLSFNTLSMTNGPHAVSLRTTNLGNVERITNISFEVSNTFPVISAVSPAIGTWVTNPNQIISGLARSTPAPMAGVGLVTNGAGTPAPLTVVGGTNWSTNGPWGAFDRTTNQFMVVASNALSWAVTNVLWYPTELTAPAMGWQVGLANSTISNLTNLTASVDSYSPVTSLVGSVRKAGVVLSNYDLLSGLAGTNLVWALDIGVYSNGKYDLVLTVTNTAGWVNSVTVTNIQVTNAPPRVPTFTRFIPLLTNVTAGTPVPFHFEVLDQDTNWLKTNGVLPFTFLGSSVAPLGQSPTVAGTALGSVTPITLSQGTASNLVFVPVAAGTNTVSNQYFTNIGPLVLTVTGTNPSTVGSYLEVAGMTVDQDVTNRVWVRDLYGNPAGNAPNFVFVKVDYSNTASSRVVTTTPVATNEYRVDLRVSNGMGRYVFSAYLDATTPMDRITRDSQGAVDGWVNLDLYAYASSNIDSLIDRNKGGATVTQNPVKAGEDLNLFFKGTAGQKVTLIVSDLGGRVLRRQEMTLIQDGLQFQTFPAKDTVGRNLPPGIYFILLKTQNPNTEKYFKLVITR